MSTSQHFAAPQGTSHKSDLYFSRLYISVFMITMVVALAVMLVLQFAQSQYERDMRGWQVKLSLIADSRLGAVDSWLERQFADMRELAEDPYVKALVSKEKSGDALKRDAYLRQLLNITAERSGFTPDIPAQIIADESEANSATGGIALLDIDKRVLFSSRNMPPLTGDVELFLQQARPDEAQMMDVASAHNGAALRMGFLLPVYAAKTFEAPAHQTGWVFGLREVGRDLFGLLQHPGVIEATLETLLVREENGGVTYLTPLADGTPALRKHLSLPDKIDNEQALASAFAMQDAGSFALRTDYRLKDVLVTGRKVPGTPWTLVSKVDEDEAMAAARSERNGLIMQLLLAVLVVFVAVIAAWRHGTSRNATRVATQLKTALRKAETREQMLEVITNTQPGAIFIVDTAEQCCYANEAFSEQLGNTREGVLGKTLDNLVGAALAREYHRANEAALADDKTIMWTRREANREGEGERVFRVKHIPLHQLPMEHAAAGAKGVLVVEQDITALVVERERRLRTLRGIIETLVAMVDRRDPYAANHSKMVAIVSRKVAEEMDIDATLVETAEIAGTVMNIGKMVVPAEWLTKPGALNDKERTAIRESLLESAAMLDGVEFEGPVAETLRQSLEQWDGSGPQKLKGEDIIVTARIVAAANAFVGMVSPRSYRKAMTVDEALNVLMKAIDSEFDRKAVVALANYIDNHGGRAMIASLAQEPEDE